MLELNNRLVFYYEFTIDSMPSPDKPLKEFPFEYVLERIEPAFKLGNAECLIGAKEDACVRIQAMSVDEANEAVTFLVNFTDEKLANPTLQKIHSRHLRKVKKDHDEGLAVSIHIVLSTIKNTYGNYIGLVEYIPGLSKYKYLRLFNSLFRKYCTDVVLDEKTKKTRHCYPKIDSAILEGDAVADALQDKPLSGVELIRYDHESIDMDEEDDTLISREVLFLKPKDKLFANEATSWIHKCAQRGSHKNYSHMRIKFKNTDGKDATTTVSTAEVGGGELYFGKKRLISFNTPLDQGSEQIHNELSEDMKLLLLEEMAVN